MQSLPLEKAINQQFQREREVIQQVIRSWTFFKTSSKLSLKISCKSELNLQITNTLKYIGVRNACWRFWKLQSFYHIQFSINEQHINNYRNVRGIMSRCCQIRCTMWPPPSSATYSNRIHHWSIELLMNFFVSLSHTYDIAAEGPSMFSYRFKFL